MTVSFKVGQTAQLTKQIKDSDVRTFAELTGDQNPIHIDEAYAETTRFGKRIAHGMLVAGLISNELGNQLPGPGAIYLSQTLRFCAPVYLGDVITLTVEIAKIRADKPIVTLATTCTNQWGKVVIEGEAALMVPLS